MTDTSFNLLSHLRAKQKNAYTRNKVHAGNVEHCQNMWLLILLMHLDKREGDVNGKFIGYELLIEELTRKIG